MRRNQLLYLLIWPCILTFAVDLVEVRKTAAGVDYVPSVLSMVGLPIVGVVYECTRRNTLTIMMLIMCALAATLPWLQAPQGKRWIASLFIVFATFVLANPVANDVVFADSLSSSACLVLLAQEVGNISTYFLDLAFKDNDLHEKADCITSSVCLFLLAMLTLCLVGSTQVIEES